MQARCSWCGHAQDVTHYDDECRACGECEFATPAAFARSRGYAWALKQEQYSEYNDAASYQAFQAAVAPSEEDHDDLWAVWEVGAFDAKWLFRSDIMMSVADICQATGFHKSYVQAEIKRGNLSALKFGNSYAVHHVDFAKWMDNPRRGSRTKSEE